MWELSKEEAESIIRSSDMSEHADNIIKHLQPSLQLETRRIDVRHKKIGESRIGGNPDLPEDFAWPDWHSGRSVWDPKTQKSHRSEPERRYLHFVAQLNLEDVNEHLPTGMLPGSGMLYFFYDFDTQPWGFDPSDRGGAKVFHVDSQIPLLPRSHPDRKTEFESHACWVNFHPCWTIPDWEAYSFQVEDGWDAIAELKQSLDPRSESRDAIHRIFGWPEMIQGDMQLECQLVTNGIYCGDSNGFTSSAAKRLDSGAKDWRLLLQIDTDEEGPGWMWGDCGRLYYWMRQNDLENGRFENAHLILQCS